MPQICARLPDELVNALDQAAKTQHRSRADIIRKAVEYYLNDFEKMNTSLEQNGTASDPVMDWAQVKRVINYGTSEKCTDVTSS